MAALASRRNGERSFHEVLASTPLASETFQGLGAGPRKKMFKMSSTVKPKGKTLVALQQFLRSSKMPCEKAGRFFNLTFGSMAF